MKIGSYGHTVERSRRSTAPWVIYHNPRCAKSREALDLLRQNQIDPEVREYLETPLSRREIEALLSTLAVSPKEIIRVKEKIFESLNIDPNDRSTVVNAIAEHPELLERPIVVHGDKAVIARPPERVLELID
jgi:arsenate reductase (glutaredoxin)